ncbi:MAG: ABC transporter permease [Ignavibacteria bacterium]|jgi:ABC-type antimicrobial peptide transport system permease subunit
MFINYLKIAFRIFRKQKLFSLINIFGLALGMACTILILLWVQDELNFDKFNKNADNIYRVVEIQHYSGGEIFPVAVTPGPLARALDETYPEIVHSTRFTYGGRNLRYGDKNFRELVAFADPEFLKIFSYPLVIGNSADGLDDLHSILLTEKSAEKYFGKENPLGKTIIINDSLNLKVTGVLKDIPANSHLRFDFLVNFEFLKILGRELEEWSSNSFYTYVLLQQNANVLDVDQKIKDEIKKYNEGSVTDLELQPLLNIHLYSAGKYTADIGGLGNIEYVHIFSLIAFIVLFIACINFMNLSTARATKRAREVGLRKVIGADRWYIIKQFYSESILFAFLALLIAMVISFLLLNAFNDLTSKEMSISSLGSSTFIGLIVLTIFTGIVSGSYPAIYLSSFLPVKVIKSDSVIHGGGSLFRKILVVTQFSLSLILIIGTLVISSQLDYIRNKNLGFNRENIVVLSTDKSILNNIETFKNELKQNPKIISVAAASSGPTYVGNSTSGIDWDGKNEDEVVLMHFVATDHDFINAFNMQMVEGRFYSDDYGSDSSSVVINEEAAKIMGMNEPVGKTLTMWGDKLNIIGVVKNFNFKPLDTKIEPLVLRLNNEFLFSMFVRVRPGDLPGTLGHIENVYKEFTASAPFDYHFLDEDFDNLYRSESRMQSIFSYFAILAIIISCLGLFGLASYIAERRAKEIGIRKVLGASISGVTILLSKEFINWVLLANIIAWPVAYYLMNNWLQDFVYRINLTLWPFLISGLLALLIAIATVSFQSIKAAIANPVDSLRNE